jgi:thioredoxin-related protein
MSEIRTTGATQALRMAGMALVLSLCTLGVVQAEQARGKIVGGQVSEHPAWFKESFLDIAEDVDEAAAADRHLMLFLHLNGCPYCYKMVEENIKHAPYTDFIRERFDVIALNIRGDREVAFNEDISLTEKQLAERLRVVYTPTVIFLDHDNRVVARVNGYRSVEDFRHVLDYVDDKAYLDSTLADYIDRRKRPQYAFREHPQLVETRDLSAADGRPVAVLFEDHACGACDALHDGHLADPAVREILDRYLFVRLDALSEEPIVDPAGKPTTPRRMAADLGLTYRPGLVLFDDGAEIMRIESLLYRYHFTEILRYVGERLYWQYPDSFYDYLDARTAELLAAGQDVNLGETRP